MADMYRFAHAQPARAQQRSAGVLLSRKSARPTPTCPLCGMNHNDTAFADNGYELRVCAECDLFFVHPYPAPGTRHEEITNSDIQGIQLLDCKRRYLGERFYYDRHFSMIEKECAAAKSILDVGCGTGHLLERLSSRGDLRLCGIELNREAAQFARYVAGCEITETPFEEYQGNERFDVITLINVFSHITSFDALFEGFKRALNPGGKVVLRTSEMRRNVSRWNQLHWGIPDDLHFMGLGTLEYLCRRYNFEVRRHVRLPYEEELFRASRWRQVGRNSAVNAIKTAGVLIPGALPAMKSIYRAALGQRLFVSFVVLLPKNDDNRFSQVPRQAEVQ